MESVGLLQALLFILALFLDLKKEYAKRTIVPEFMKTNPMYFV